MEAMNDLVIALIGAACVGFFVVYLALVERLRS